MSDSGAALSRLRTHAEQGNLDAQSLLALVLGKGLSFGGEQDAKKWELKAREDGFGALLDEYGGIDALRGAEKNEVEAVEWARKAADQGHARAQFLFANHLSDGIGIERNREEAADWYEQAADQGYAAAQCSLGFLLSNDSSLTQRYEGEAVEWFLKAAEQGHAAAQYYYGFHRLHGWGVEQDQEQATKWFRKAAELGFIDAQYSLGLHLAKGVGVEKNEEEAVVWYRKAAEQGEASAQFSLAEHLSGGIGVEKNEKEAVEWYRKAAAQGHDDAESRLEDLLSKIDAGERPHTQLEWNPEKRCNRSFNAYTAYEHKHYMQVLCAVLNKPNWWLKFRDESIVAKWRIETRLKESEFNYMLQELEFLAEHQLLRLPPKDNSVSSEAIVSPVTSLGVYVSDSVIPESLRQHLIELAKPLEEEALAQNNWHPGSDGMVLDLVHPSPYCFAFGKTRIATKPGVLVADNGTHSLKPARNERDKSKTTMWLPSDIRVEDDGHVVIESYINNLNPKKHSKMYKLISAVLRRMMPMFAASLMTLNNDAKPTMRIDIHNVVATAEEKDVYEQRVAEKYIELKSEHLSDEEKEEIRSDPLNHKGCEEFMQSVPRNIPTAALPSEFKVEDLIQAPPSVDVIEPLNGSKLQVIVKLANIVLTPDKPKYMGGSWHLEGMRNEAIVATGIFYYDMHNITTSRLHFRQKFAADLEDLPSYEQHDHDPIFETLGLSNEENAIQETGFIEAMQGRCVTFPNFMQHQVQPFELADKTKPGYRKMLAFFVVDPKSRIISTNWVPPQQKSWLRDSLVDIFQHQLPYDCIDFIIQNSLSDCIMTKEEAESYAAILMNERKAPGLERYAFGAERISLCEH